ncbi:unannotated protein [freshwater metagenome]|uniref:Unannotated protein n=1 Tax=freshwater metagenome TaxID=449393 RepID=A0A6J7DMK4_9ZZZZ|nr:hypothetical protein [Actinomycetota bacterium]
MRKLVLVAFAIIVANSSSAIAAPKPIAIKEATVITADIQAEGIASSGTNLITFTSTTSATLDVTVVAKNLSGSDVWSKVIDSGQNEMATVITSDSSGNIWLAGSSSSIPAPETVTAQIGAINPDGVNIETLPKLRKDMDQISLWLLSPNGDLISTFSFPLKASALVTAIAVDSKGATIAGLRANGAFVLSVSQTGIFGKLVPIGTSKTSINAVTRNSDATVSAFGSSSETLGGKKLVGAIDGVLIKISKTATIASVVRSSAPKAKRSWNSSTPSSFLTGDVISPKGNEIAITKFTSQFAPTWTTRYSGSGKAIGMNLSGGNFAVAMAPSALPAGLSGSKLAKGQSLVVLFNGKGVITSGYTNPAMGAPIAATYSPDGGISVLAKGIGAQTISIFHLISR